MVASSEDESRIRRGFPRNGADLAIAQNPQTKPEVLEGLAQMYSQDVAVQIALAGNPNTPNSVLYDMAIYKSREIAEIANAQIEKT
jgi:hypothetical protein